jgi:signal transduction histidine kinase
MERHGRTLREAGAIDIDFRAETDQELLSPEARSVLFSAVQEFTAKAITNGANKQLGIVLSSEGPSVLLEMKGSFDSQGEAGRDLGCPAIRERVGALGGRLDMTPGSVRIALPTALTAAA